MKQHRVRALEAVHGVHLLHELLLLFAGPFCRWGVSPIPICLALAKAEALEPVVDVDDLDEGAGFN